MYKVPPTCGMDWQTERSLLSIRTYYADCGQPTMERILRELTWWGQIYGDFIAGFPDDARESILKLAVSKTLTQDQVNACDALSATIEDLINNLAALLVLPAGGVAKEELPPDL
jgi:hypothetical protein